MSNNNELRIRTRCTTTIIDYSKCEPAVQNTSEPSCGFACVKADRMYDRNILRVGGNRPVLAVPEEMVQKVSNESLSWEYACDAAGNGAIWTTVDFEGLEEYRKK